MQLRRDLYDALIQQIPQAQMTEADERIATSTEHTPAGHFNGGKEKHFKISAMKVDALENLMIPDWPTIKQPG